MMIKTLVGSQVRKNIIANIVGRVINGRKGVDVANDIQNIESALSDLGRSSIEEMWGINDNGTITDEEALYKLLKENLEDEDAASNVIDLLKQQVPLDSIFHYIDKIESVLYSKITKATVKLRSIYTNV